MKPMLPVILVVVLLVSPSHIDKFRGSTGTYLSSSATRGGGISSPTAMRAPFSRFGTVAGSQATARRERTSTLRNISQLAGLPVVIWILVVDDDRRLSFVVRRGSQALSRVQYLPP